MLLTGTVKTKVEKLAEALNGPATAAQADVIMRSLIDRIVPVPVDGALEAERRGDLATIAVFAEMQKRERCNGNAGAWPWRVSSAKFPVDTKRRAGRCLITGPAADALVRRSPKARSARAAF